MPPEPEFEIAVRSEGSRAFVAPSGELDIATAPALRASLDDVVAAGVSEVVVDLRGLTFIDSTGVRLLVRANSAASDGGPAFAIVEGPRAIQRVLELTGVAELLRRVDPDDA